MQSLAFKHALCDHSQFMLAFNEGLAHNLGAAWRRFFKIADRVQARGPGFEGCTKPTPYCLLWSDCPRHKRRADLGAAVRIRASAAIQSAKAHINQLLMRNFAASAGGSRG